AFSIAQSRRDPVDEAHWRSLAETVVQRSDVGARVRRMEAFYRDDLEALARDVVAEHRLFYGRLDYLHRTLARLIDRRDPIEGRILGELVDSGERRVFRS